MRGHSGLQIDQFKEPNLPPIITECEESKKVGEAAIEISCKDVRCHLKPQLAAHMAHAATGFNHSDFIHVNAAAVAVAASEAGGAGDIDRNGLDGESDDARNPWNLTSFRKCNTEYISPTANHIFCVDGREVESMNDIMTPLQRRAPSRRSRCFTNRRCRRRRRRLRCRRSTPPLSRRPPRLPREMFNPQTNSTKFSVITPRRNRQRNG